MRRVLVVDDEENIRVVLRTLLKKHNYQVEAAESAEIALEQLERFDPDFVLADVRMSGMTGLELCAEVKARSSLATVILMSAYGSVDLAIDAMKAGAYDYISKPFKQDEVLIALTKAEERESLRRENRALKEAMRKEQTYRGILGKSDAINKVFSIIGKVAEYKTTVLIQGESGTGKELVARALHSGSSRKNEPFVPLNCGAIPETLLESELFGHKKGAFTDAHADKKGLFAAANRGTLFLDEIGELPLTLQVKLLRVLQEGRIRPLGATRDQGVDVRVVAATVRDLRREVEEKRFREDLYYRLNVLQINVPPLRDRRDDIMLLVEHFMERNNGRLGTKIRELDPHNLASCCSTTRGRATCASCENTIERAVVLAEGDVVVVGDLPERLREPADPVAASLSTGELSIKKTARFMEETLIRRALGQDQGQPDRCGQDPRNQPPRSPLQNQRLWDSVAADG